MDGTNHTILIGFGALDVTEQCKFIVLGAMDVTKPYKLIGFGAMAPTQRSLISYFSEIGPEVVSSGGLNGPLLPGDLTKKVGGEAPHLFQ